MERKQHVKQDLYRNKISKEYKEILLVYDGNPFEVKNYLDTPLGCY